MKALVYVLPLALVLYALIDLSRSEPIERAGIHPLAWVAIIVLLPVIGPLAWLVASRTQRAAVARPTARRTVARPGPLRRSGPLAPDDDPQFLWRLEQKRRRERRDDDGDIPSRPDDGTPQA